jgi:hypothetical protein
LLALGIVQGAPARRQRYKIIMKQCMAYRVSRFHRNAWVRCQQPRKKGHPLCRAHVNSLHGALLGLWVHGFPQPSKPRGSAEQRVN